jgi:hypothetical protein
MFVNLHKLLHAAASTAMAGALIAAAMPTAKAAGLFDNLGSSQDGSDPVFGVGPLAQSFSTGAAGEGLIGVQLLLTSLSAAYTGSIQVSLLADNFTSPGATLAVLGSLANAAVSTTSYEVYDFLPASTIDLAANTRYWVEIAESTPNAIQWSYSYDQTAVGVANASAYSSAFGVDPSSSYGAYQLAVDVPEPGTFALLTGGLFCLGLIRRSRVA